MSIPAYLEIPDHTLGFFCDLQCPEIIRFKQMNIYFRPHNMLVSTQQVGTLKPVLTRQFLHDKNNLCISSTIFVFHGICLYVWNQ